MQSVFYVFAGRRKAMGSDACHVTRIESIRAMIRDEDESVTDAYMFYSRCCGIERNCL